MIGNIIRTPEMGTYQHYSDSTLQSFFERMHPTKVWIENESCQNCTLVKVTSTNKQGILLKMVQVLTDLDLVISKSFISSDGDWIMDVFHVTDHFGKKLTDKNIIDFIENTLTDEKNSRGMEMLRTCSGRLLQSMPVTEQTTIEFTVSHRPNLLLNISMVLTSLHYHINSSTMWTHNKRMACIIYITEETTGEPISDPSQMLEIRQQLEQVIRCHNGNDKRMMMRVFSSSIPSGKTHTERRLHQMLYDDKDYEECMRTNSINVGEKIEVTIENCNDKEYIVVNTRCRDRARLFLDTVCTLTDLQYNVCHASVHSLDSIATQEYYIRKSNGCSFNTESEKRRLTECLVAAIERRASHGLRLEVCTQNKPGLLSHITNVLYKYGLCVTRMDIGTRDNMAFGSFFVTRSTRTDLTDNIDDTTLDAVKNEIGPILKVNSTPIQKPKLKPKLNPNDSIVSIGMPKLSLARYLWAHLERIS